MKIHAIRAVRFCLIVTLLSALPAIAGEGIRLDTRVSPTVDVVELFLDANRTEYRRSVETHLTVHSPTNVFRFHAENMAFDCFALEGGGDRYGLEFETGDEGLVTATADRNRYLAAARQFFARPENSVDGTESNMAKVADQLMDCVNLREREGAAVADYLTGNR